MLAPPLEPSYRNARSQIARWPARSPFCALFAIIFLLPRTASAQSGPCGPDFPFEFANLGIFGSQGTNVHGPLNGTCYPSIELIESLILQSWNSGPITGFSIILENTFSGVPQTVYYVNTAGGLPPFAQNNSNWTYNAFAVLQVGPLPSPYNRNSKVVSRPLPNTCIRDAPPQSKSDAAQLSFVGNPINVALGNKYEQVTDYTTAGQNKLEFTRYYSSLVPTPVLAATLGSNWRSSYDRYLKIGTSSVVAERADGRVFQFMRNGTSFTTDSDVDVQLSQMAFTFTLMDSDDTVETYVQQNGALNGTISPQAQLTSIKKRNGYTQNLQYDSTGNLASVIDSYGRTLQFAYQDNRLASVTTPDGLVLNYSYDSSGKTAGVVDRLISVGYSTTPVTTRTYLYENPSLPFALTGIIDENGNRYATWSYDSTGRALSSEHGGGADRTTVVYNDADGSRTVTNALGQQEIFKFTTLQGVPKLSEIDRIATATTAAATRLFTYDGAGYVASQTDCNANQTNYVNDARGQPTAITEAAGSPQQRVTSISYHPNFHLPTQVVAPGLTANFVYDNNGQLLTRTAIDTTTGTIPYATAGTTRIWKYSWANFLLTSVQGPRTDVAALTSFSYDATGALTAVTNALGQVTRITQHLPGGLAQTILDANGVTTQLAYDARQRLISSTTPRKADWVRAARGDPLG